MTEKDVLVGTIAELKKKAIKETNAEEKEWLLGEVQDLIFVVAELEVPTPIELTTDDTMPEGLLAAMAEQGGRRSNISDEGAFIQILDGRYSDNPAIEGIVQAYSGMRAKVRCADRKLSIEHPVLTVGIATQPEAWQRLENSWILKGKGFLDLFSWCWPAPMAGKRTHTTPHISDQTAARFAENLTKLLNLRPANDVAQDDENRHVVRFFKAAQALFIRFLQHLETLLGETGALDEDAARRFGQARTLLTVLLSERTCPEFLTLPAYLRHMAGGALQPAPVPAAA
jgi:hypothetical protein